ncbi:MAG: hypothetical protein ACI9I0_000352 [Rhodoferax sp.]|jgi:hypothetical protein
MIELTETAAPAVMAVPAAVPAAILARSADAPVLAVPQVTKIELDKSILSYALVNGGLELLPPS